MDGLEVMDELNQIVEATYLPILMLTGDVSPEARREALSRGAKDFVNKPFNRRRSAAAHRHAARDAVPLPADPEPEPDARSQGARAHARARRRRRSRSSSGSRAPPSSATTTPVSTPSGSARWRRSSRRQIGLPDAQVSLIRRAAPLHDVGKIGIPDSILLKLGKLTAEEFELVKTHTVNRRADSLRQPIRAAAPGGGNRVQPSRTLGRFRLRRHGRKSDSARRTHRRASPTCSTRSRRSGRTRRHGRSTEAIAEIERQRGLQFDPSIVDAFLRVIDSNSSPRDPPIGSADMHTSRQSYRTG